MKWTPILATVAACIVCVHATCPGGTIDFGDNGTETCLLFVTDRNNWHGTRLFCQQLGYDLAKLTGDLHQKVTEYLQHQGESFKNEDFWIGGTDEVTEGSWKWIVDESPIHLGTPHWYQCERLNIEPNGGPNENHLCLETPKFYFHSCSGVDYKYGICQYFK